MLKIYWFRKDLRIADNLGLHEFINQIEKDDHVLLLYIKNSNSFKFFGEKRVKFLLESLAELKNDIAAQGLYLNILKGSAAGIFSKILGNHSPAVIYANEQPEPYSRKRDKEVEEICRRNNSSLKLYTDSTLFPLGDITKADGTPYIVFTPYSKVVFERLTPGDCRKINIDLSSLKEYKQLKLKGFDELKPADALKELQASSIFTGGREEGLKALKRFYENSLSGYKSKRDFPAAYGTSRLSPHLHFGTVGIREAVRTACIKLKKVNTAEKPQVNTWLKELVWREFYYNISFYFPYVDKESFQKKFDRLLWNHSNKMFSAWQEGRTGYPIVDAGMRQLNTEGWLHNRLRMITAMFLTKHLLIDWRKGEKYFAENLVDMDFSSNNGGWQWSASTGVDAQPYFRIFNPVLQSKKFDAEGLYIKKYLPELNNIPPKYIHSPWEMTIEDQHKYKIVIGKDYPFPIVEHKQARETAIKEYGSIK